MILWVKFLSTSTESSGRGYLTLKGKLLNTPVEERFPHHSISATATISATPELPAFVTVYLAVPPGLLTSPKLVYGQFKGRWASPCVGARVTLSPPSVIVAVLVIFTASVLVLVLLPVAGPATVELDMGVHVPELEKQGFGSLDVDVLVLVVVVLVVIVVAGITPDGVDEEIRDVMRVVLAISLEEESVALDIELEEGLVLELLVPVKQLMGAAFEVQTSSLIDTSSRSSL